MNFLNDEYAPLTDTIGFLEAPFETVVYEDKQWRAELGGYAGRRVSGGIRELLEALLPLTGPLLRYEWVESPSMWTAYFDNSRIGGDPFGPISYLSKRLGSRGVIVSFRPQTERTEGGARFDLYGQEPVDWLNCTRCVCAINDGGRWTWDEIGSVQPFEEIAHYRAKRIRDRLTEEMLERYCKALGIRPFDADFYGQSGFLVENKSIKYQPITETLAEARQSLGYSPRS
jgi:hypothetical protein